MSLFNRVKMMAVFSAALAAILPRPPRAAQPIASPNLPAVPPYQGSMFDPFAFLNSGMNAVLVGPYADAAIARLLAWKRQGSNAYHSHAHPRKRRVNAWRAVVERA